MANPWITHLKAFYAKNKSKMTYTQAMKEARKSYKPAGKTSKTSKPKKQTKKDKMDESKGMKGRIKL